MIKSRFEELEKRNRGDKLKLCFELYCDTFNAIPYEHFTHYFQMWLNMFAGKTIDQAIQYFKDNKL